MPQEPPGAAAAASNRPPARPPLDVAWLAHEIEPMRAGSDSIARIVLRNEGTATLRSRGDGGVRASYHWLDRLRNPVIWDGTRTSLLQPLPPGSTVELPLTVRAPQPPGEYILVFDLVEEFRFWLSEVGVPTLEVAQVVEPRIARRRLAAVIHPGPGDPEQTRIALKRQHEPLVEDDATAVAHLVAGCLPDPDWSTRVLDAHEEGFAAVGCALAPPGRLAGGRRFGWLAPWAPRATRDPRFDRPLLLPSLVEGLEPSLLNDWPAFAANAALPGDVVTTLFDGRIVLRLRPRSGRRPR